MKTKIISTILILILFFGCCIEIYADTKSDLNNQSNTIDSQIKEKENEISEVNSELSDAMQEVQTLITKINTYEDSISELNAKITEKEEEITNKEKEIENTQKTIDEKQELLDERLISLYMSGQTSYIELLLSSSDLTDFISKYYLISELATYDADLIQSIRDAKETLEKSKTELETSKTELESSKSKLEEEQNALALAKSEKQTKVNALSAEEKSLETELEELEADKKAVQNKLAEIARQEQVASGGSASSYGYIFPVLGCSKSNISNLSFPSYSGHTGVDININVTGKSVVAVKAGTVVISEAKVRNGSYYSYGEYVAINHHDGTITLYAHMLAGSRTVSVGDTVSQGQVIGTVGSTGNSTGNHLHFEVRLNGAIVNPIPYLP